MASTLSGNEKRPLKRPRLGPPDFYPQDPKQKEDELTQDKLKAGYINHTIHGEHESAKVPRYMEKWDEHVNKITQSYTSVVAKKNEQNAWNDRERRKLPCKDIGFWHASAKPKDKDIWFRDLAGNKALAILAKRFPIFNKKEEIFGTLCEFYIPMSRAVWFIKMTAAYYTMQQESGKMKKKSHNDPCSDWTNHLSRFLRELLIKLNDYYKLNSQTFLTTDVEKALKEWQYCSRLTRHMYEEGLLDRQEYLNWLTEIFGDKSFNPDCVGILKLFTPFLMQFLDGIKQSEILSRRLTFICCQKLNQLYQEFDNGGSVSPSNSNARAPSAQTCLQEYVKQCGYHRHVILSLSSIIQTLIVDCPTALVWNYLGDIKPLSDTKHNFLCGSPLDHLPCSPSLLPMPDSKIPTPPNSPGEKERPITTRIRSVLRTRELEVIRRSHAVDARWSSSKCQQSGMGTVVPLMLATLDTLDQAPFNSNITQELFNKIFAATSEEGDEAADATVIKLLCHWAMSAHRSGSHRALAVVRLLEIRGKDAAQTENQSSNYPFQQTLFSFLDSEATVTDDMNDKETCSVVHLFAEFIRADLFSHDQYVRSLIASGELNSSTPVCALKRANEERDFSEPDEPRVDMHNVWSALADDKCTVDKSTPLSVSSSAPDSLDQQAPSSVESYTEPCSAVATAALQIMPSKNKTRKPDDGLSRHQRIVIQLPVPQEEQYRHECNQRNTLLFGFGAAREANKHSLKKLTKELNKIWQKKSCLECSENGGFKIKRKIGPDALQSLAQKFKDLCAYDQRVVLGHCADACVEQLKDFTSRETQLLPSTESIDFLLGLMETSMDIGGMIDFIEEVSELLYGVENELTLQNSSLASTYAFRICVVFIGYLRLHRPYLLMCPNELSSIVKNFLSLVERSSDSRHQSGPSSVWERVLLSFLSSLQEHWPTGDKWHLIRDRCHKSLVRNDEKPSAANLKWDAGFLREYLDNPKKCIDPVGLVSSCGLGREREGAQLRYSFVINALLAASRSDNDKILRLSELGAFCANVSTACPQLASEWLGGLRALCCSGNLSAMNQGFSDLLMQLDVNAQSLHPQIATFAMLLVSYGCMSLSDLSLHVLVPSLLASIKGDAEAESGALLTLRIVAAVFCVSDEQSRMIGSLPSLLNAERYLLASEHASMAGQGVLGVLMGVFLLGDSTEQGGGEPKDTPARRFAADVLWAICCEEWIKHKFLYQADVLNDKRLNDLLKNFLKNEQAQRLLRLISRRPQQKTLIAELAKCDNHKDLIMKELGALSLWNMRAVTLDLQVLLKQATPIEQMGLLEVISKACMDLFHNQTMQHSNNASFSVAEVKNFWLVAPLISRLPSNVQGKVLRAATQVLENGQLARKEKSGSSAQQSSWLLGQQPFLCLVLTCLRGQDEQRESILNSLLKQLQDYAQRAKENPICIYQRDFAAELREGLQLRLSLVGGMFETVCKGTNCDAWALLLFQLILYEVVSVEANRTLFETCLDMLTVLIHASQIPEPGSMGSGDESRKLYSSIMRKLKKELGDRNGPQVGVLQQLLPIPRAVVDLVTCEPHGTQKNNKQPVDKTATRAGLRFVEKQRVSPWDLVEGWRGWNWSWFQAVKVDCQPETVQARVGRLLYHEHHKLVQTRPLLPGQKPDDYEIINLRGEIQQPPPHEMPPAGMVPPPHMQPHQMPRPPDQMASLSAGGMIPPQAPMFPHQAMMPPEPQHWQTHEMPQPVARAKGRQRKSGGSRSNRRNSKSSAPPPQVFTTPQPGFAVPSQPAQQAWPQQNMPPRFGAQQSMMGMQSSQVNESLRAKIMQRGDQMTQMQMQQQQGQQMALEGMMHQPNNPMRPQMPQQQQIPNRVPSYGAPGAGSQPMQGAQFAASRPPQMMQQGSFEQQQMEPMAHRLMRQGSNEAMQIPQGYQPPPGSYRVPNNPQYQMMPNQPNVARPPDKQMYYGQNFQ